MREALAITSAYNQWHPRQSWSRSSSRCKTIAQRICRELRAGIPLPRKMGVAAIGRSYDAS